MQDAHRTELLEFTGYPGSFHARLDASMRPMIGSLLKGWSISSAENSGLEHQIEILVRQDHEMTVRGSWIGQEYSLKDPVDGACSFIAEALMVQANESTENMCVHSAAAVFCGRAVLFPARFRAGKSTLSAVLAARGLNIIADDAVHISPAAQNAISPGISPRMRLPIPDSLARQSKTFLAAAMGLTGKRYGYLALPDDQLLTNGKPTPIGAFVYLNRNPDGGDAVLAEIPKAEALKTLIWQNFARQTPAGRILACLSDLVASRPTLELRYAEAEDAADLLERRFSTWPEEAAPVSGRDLVDEDYKAIIGDPRWRAKPNIVEKGLDTGHFIADEDTGRIFHLNSTAGAIWRMLSAGEDSTFVASLLSEAFPDIDSQRIKDDVVKLTQSFRENGLLMALNSVTDDRSNVDL